MSFTVRCYECGNEVEITAKNVEDFVHEYGYRQFNFKVNEECSIGTFITYDECNETVLCKCGHRVER